MENATKALLIAAAILIAIVLIAVGIKVLSSTSGVTDEVGKVTEATGVAVFNSQFTDYLGQQSAANVKALLSKVATTYRNGSTHKVKIKTVKKEGNGLGNGTQDTAHLIGGTTVSKLVTGYTYNISIPINSGYDSNGYIAWLQIE